MRLAPNVRNTAKNGQRDSDPIPQWEMSLRMILRTPYISYCTLQRTLPGQFLCGMWHTRTIHQWKPQLETIPSMYSTSTFAAELIQPPFRQLTFSHVRHCSPDYTVDSMYSTHTTDGNHARTQMVLTNQDSSDPKLNVVERGKEFCVQLR